VLCLPVNAQAHTSRVRLLLRRLLRAGNALTDVNRREFVRQRVRVAFDEQKQLREPADVEEALILSETHLDSLRAQTTIAHTQKKTTTTTITTTRATFD
jgi:hypothetical protein